MRLSAASAEREEEFCLVVIDAVFGDFRIG